MSERANADLVRRAGTGFAWTLAAVTLTRIAGFIGIVVLARLLTPEHFGLLGFALAVLVYVEAIGDLGTGAALVYWPGRRDDAAQITFVANLVFGLAWAVLGWLLAPAIGAFFEAPDAVPVLRAMIWVVPLRFLGNTPDALLRRELHFRARLLPEATGSLTRLGVSVAGAVSGAGVWSLVAGHLVGQAIHTAMLWRAVDWRPGARLPADLVRPMLGYGAGLVAVDCLAAVTHHIDLVIVGKALGTHVLGLYQVAARIPEVTVLVLVWVVGKVLFPTFARLHGDGGDAAPVYLRTIRYLAAAVLPVGVGLVLVAPALVPQLFGGEWTAAAPILQGLAAYATLRALGSPAGDLLKGTGRSGLLASLGVVKAAVLVPALLLASRHDAPTIAWTLAGVALAGTLLNFAVAARIARFGPTDLLRQLMPAAAASSVMTGTVLAGRAFLDPGEPLGLLATVGLAGVVYAAALRVLDPEIVTCVGRLLRPGALSPTDTANAHRTGEAVP